MIGSLRTHAGNVTNRLLNDLYCFYFIRLWTPGCLTYSNQDEIVGLWCGRQCAGELIGPSLTDFALLWSSKHSLHFRPFRKLSLNTGHCQRVDEVILYYRVVVRDTCLSANINIYFPLTSPCWKKISWLKNINIYFHSTCPCSESP